MGTIIYSLPFSPWLLVVGHFISGSGGSIRAVIYGELARCHSDEKISSKLSLMAIATGIGSMIGPVINIAFASVDFWILEWNITYENMAGIYVTILFTIAQGLACLFAYDLSKEYDMKADQVNAIEIANTVHNQDSIEPINNVDNENINAVVETNTYDRMVLGSKDKTQPLDMKSSKQNTLSIIKIVLCDYDFLFVILLSFLSWNISLMLGMCLPLLVTDTMNWTTREMNIILFSIGAVYVITFLIFTFKSFPNNSMYIINLLSVVALAIHVSIFMVLSKYNNFVSLNIVMWVIYCVSFGLIAMNAYVFLPSLLARMVTSDIQTFSESILYQ